MDDSSTSIQSDNNESNRLTMFDGPSYEVVMSNVSNIVWYNVASSLDLLLTVFFCIYYICKKGYTRWSSKPVSFWSRVGRASYWTTMTFKFKIFCFKQDESPAPSSSTTSEPSKSPGDIFIVDLFTDLGLLIMDKFFLISNDKPLSYAEIFIRKLFPLLF